MSPNKTKKGAAGVCEQPTTMDTDTPLPCKSKRRRLSSEDEDDFAPSKKAATPSSKLGFNGLRSPGSTQSHNKPAELFRKDLISAMKLADSETLQQDSYILISDSWKQEWEKGVQVPVNQSDIPNVVIKKQLHKPSYGDFKLKNPKKMLHAFQDEIYRQGIHELTGMHQLAEQVVRYDLDDLDVCWLQKANEDREEIGQTLIHEWTLERIIEAFENQCHESMHNMIKTEEGLGIEYDENIVCEVCKSPDSEDSNEMVFCDGCDICVHQACYGIQSIPEGNWLCRTCALSFKPRCILCPKTGGAMKSTKSGTKWAHVSCALWIPEVSIGCAEKMEPITKISMIPASRWALVCCLCKERYGACIQCSVKTCKTSFHVTCGFQNNLNMKTILDDSEDSDGVKLRAFCPKHSKKHDQSSDSDSDSPRKESVGTPRKDMTKEELANLRAKKIKELEAEFYTIVNVAKIAEALSVDEEVVELVLFYWKLKRKVNFDKPLLMPKTEEADLLERQQEDSLLARMKMFVHLRQDLERVRNLCYMISRREKLKRQYYKSRETAFKATVTVLTNDNLKLTARECEKIADRYNHNSLYEGNGPPEPPVLKPMRPLKLSDIKRNLSQCKSAYMSDSESQHSEATYAPGRCIRSVSKSSGGSRSTKDEIPILEPEIPLKTDYHSDDVDVLDVELNDVPELGREVDSGTTRQRCHHDDEHNVDVDTLDVELSDTIPELGREVDSSGRQSHEDKQNDSVETDVDVSDNIPELGREVESGGRPRRRRNHEDKHRDDVDVLDVEVCDTVPQLAREVETARPKRRQHQEEKNSDNVDSSKDVEVGDKIPQLGREVETGRSKRRRHHKHKNSDNIDILEVEHGDKIPELGREVEGGRPRQRRHHEDKASDVPECDGSDQSRVLDKVVMKTELDTNVKQEVCTTSVIHKTRNSGKDVVIVKTEPESANESSNTPKEMDRGKHRKRHRHRESVDRKDRILRKSHKDKKVNENHLDESKCDPSNVPSSPPPVVSSPTCDDVDRTVQNTQALVAASPEKHSSKERRSNRQTLLPKSEGKIKIERSLSVQSNTLNSIYIVENAIKQRVQNKLLKSRKSRFLNGLHDKSLRRIDSFFHLRGKKTNSSGRSSPLDEQSGRVLNEIPSGIGKSAFEQNKLFGEQCLTKENNGYSTPQKTSSVQSGQRTPQSGRGAGDMLKDLKAIILEEGIGSPETRSVRRRIEAVFDIDVKKNIFAEAGLDSLSSKFCSDEFKNVELVTDSRGYRSQSPLSSETDSSNLSHRSRESTPRRVTRSHGVDTDENSLDSVQSLRNGSKLRLREGWLRASHFKS